MSNYFHNQQVIAKGGGSLQARGNHDDCPICNDDEPDRDSLINFPIAKSMKDCLRKSAVTKAINRHIKKKK